jgi:hypothetical protein
MPAKLSGPGKSGPFYEIDGQRFRFWPELLRISWVV